MPDCSRQVTLTDRHHRLAALATATAAALLILAVIAAPGRAGSLGPARTVVDPATGAISLGGMSIARDGTGGLVFVEPVGGVDHVFASRLIGGVFQAPEQLDGGLVGPSSQPVVAAGNGGVVLAAFVNGGTLYVAGAPGTGATFGPAAAIYPNGQNPSIQMSNFGKAYLAFTAAENGGSDVRAAYYYAGRWANVTGPLNSAPGDDAGTGLGRPDAATAGDGTGIVAWGEQGHVYARRVVGVTPSVQLSQMDPAAYAGATETAADSPAVSVGGDSSYYDVAFRSVLQGGQARVLLTREVAERTLNAVAIDGIAGSGQSAGQPQVAMNEYGRGFATAANTSNNALLSTYLNGNGQPSGGAAQTDPSTNTGLPYAAPALAGLTSTLIAYQQTTVGGAPEIDLRYAQNGGSLALPMTVSSSAGGPTQAAQGLAAAGDTNGDAAVAWIQGATGAQSLDTAQYYVPPGQAVPAYQLTYTRNPQPVLSWAAGREAWGPLTYTVELDGAPIGQTTATAFTVPAALPDGPHTWQITATNPANLASTSATATVFVDTTPPRLRLSIGGRARAQAPITLHLTGVDAAQQLAGARASGITATAISWGDGASTASPTNLRAARHVYRRPGIYRIAVRVTDQAGNATTIARYLRILR